VPATISGVVLQIGSYKSEAEARQSWNSFRSQHDAAAGYQADVKAVDLGARGTWYRLRMGPFADRKAALSACTKLKADGASCLLAQ
jgi:cell division protein FtsN